MKVHEFNLDTCIRGREVEVIGTWAHGDDSVGIFGIEVDYQIYDAETEAALNWELTDEEYESLCNLVEQNTVYMVGDYFEPMEENIE